MPNALTGFRVFIRLSPYLFSDDVLAIQTLLDPVRDMSAIQGQLKESCPAFLQSPTASKILQGGHMDAFAFDLNVDATTDIPMTASRGQIYQDRWSNEWIISAVASNECHLSDAQLLLKWLQPVMVYANGQPVILGAPQQCVDAEQKPYHYAFSINDDLVLMGKAMGDIRHTPIADVVAQRRLLGLDPLTGEHPKVAE
jgi:hypothetical protein